MNTLMSEYSKDIPMTRSDLNQLVVPAPRGRFHQPVSFYDYVNTVAKTMERRGLTIGREEHLVGHEGNRYFGLMEISGIDDRVLEGEYIPANDWSLFLGLRGSHDQSVPRGIALGRHVMVCSNLCFSGDVATISTKQTLNVLQRLPGMINQALANVPQLAVSETHRVEALKAFTMKPRWGDAALVEIHRRNGLTAAQLGRAIAEWDRPSYEEHAEHGHTAWRLEQAVTEAAKPTGERSPNMLMVQERTSVATSFINEVIGF